MEFTLGCANTRYDSNVDIIYSRININIELIDLLQIYLTILLRIILISLQENYTSKHILSLLRLRYSHSLSVI